MYVTGLIYNALQLVGRKSPKRITYIKLAHISLAQWNTGEKQTVRVGQEENYDDKCQECQNHVVLLKFGPWIIIKFRRRIWM